MENASKALLIAGSVLIVILLIAVGVRIFNSTGDTTTHVEGTMQTTAITMFNNKFMPYVGLQKSRNDALSLANLIIANNSTNDIKIKIQYKIKTQITTYEYNVPINGTANTIKTAQELLLKRISECGSQSKFTIRVDSYTAQGYIEKIYITNV